MKAKVEKPFTGARDGELHPEHFPVGSIVSGDLAAVAVREGWASPMEEHDVVDKGAAAPEPRKKPKRGEGKALFGAPENK